MQVRVFEAQDMASGLKLIRQELGPDALILSTRTLRSGKLGLLGKPILEITAAVDSQWPREQQTDQQAPAGAKMKRPAAAGISKKPVAFKAQVGGGSQDISYDDLAVAAEDRERAPSPAVMLRDVTHNKESQDGDALRSEVDELKNLVKNLAGELSRISVTQSTQDSAPEKRSSQGPKPRPAGNIQTHGGPVLHRLKQLGINEETSATLARFTQESLRGEELFNSELLNTFLADSIVNLIEVQPPDFTDLSRQQRIALVGPTGVGKTTTLAKLAAHYISNHSRSLALITIDTYRIAAVEQLKVYASIMHLPVEVVINPTQLEEALERHKDASLILIDTAGRSPRDAGAIQELTSFFKPELNIEKHLVLSASTRENELINTIRSFSELSIDRTIFTKIDECTNTGVILNTQIQNGSPLSYLTNGQRVPEDLLEISRRSVAELILTQHEGFTHD